MTNFRAGKVQDEPEISYLWQGARKCSKNDRSMSKGHRKQPEGVPIGQIWNSLGTSIMTGIDYNQLNKEIINPF